MNHRSVEIVVIVVAAVLALTWTARRFKLSEPMLLVAGSLCGPGQHRALRWARAAPWSRRRSTAIAVGPSPICGSICLVGSVLQPHRGSGTAAAPALTLADSWGSQRGRLRTAASKLLPHSGDRCDHSRRGRYSKRSKCGPLEALLREHPGGDIATPSQITAVTECRDVRAHRRRLRRDPCVVVLAKSAGRPLARGTRLQPPTPGYGVDVLRNQAMHDQRERDVWQGPDPRSDG